VQQVLIIQLHLAFGGETPAAAEVAITESWNGTSWTEVGDLNSARNSSWTFGTSTSALGLVVLQE
jgi:hypothetical protein